MVKLGAFGLGGTNVSAGIVDSKTGEVSNFKRTTLKDFLNYKDCIERFIKTNIPTGYPLGGCIAGAINDNELIANNIANSPFSQSFDFGKHLSRDYNRFTITGDVRGEGQAATLWLPEFKNKLVLTSTFSSGYNVDLVKDGIPILPNPIEAGHGPTPKIPNEFKRYLEMECACLSREGKHESHLEAYVSANASANMAKRFFLENGFDSFKENNLVLNTLRAYNSKQENPRLQIEDLINPSYRDLVFQYITGEMVYTELKKFPNQEPQKSIRSVQEYAITEAFIDMSSHYNPDTILVKGSLAEDADNWNILFEPAIKRAYKRGLKNYNEELLITRLDNNRLSVMGGAADWLRKNPN